jgi:putative ABC transport system permease protein
VIASAWLLGLRRLREQPVRALLAVAAIAAGTALLVGVLIDRWSVQASTERFEQARAGLAELEVVGVGSPAGLDAALLPAVEATDGVAVAAPLVQAIAPVQGAGGREELVVVLGVDCRIEGVVGTFGCTKESLDFAASSDLFAVSPSLRARLGDGGVLRSNLGRLPLERAQEVPELEELNGGRVVAFPLAAAQRHFGRPGAIDAVLVVSRPGTDLADLGNRLRAAVGPQNAVRLAGEARPNPMADTLLGMLLLTSLMALAVGAQLVHNVVSLSLEERRRDLAVATAIGASPRSLLTGVLAEAAMLGALGGLLGVAGGVLLARPLVEGMSNTLDDLTGLRLQVHVPPAALVAGLALGIAASVLSAIGPARRAVRRDASAELHGQQRADAERGARPRAAVVWLAVGLTGTLLTVVGARRGAIEPWQPMVGMGGFLLATVAMFRSAQLAGPPIFALLGRLPVLRDGVAGMAASNLAAAPKRSGVMVLAITAAVGTGVVLANTSASITAGSRQFAEELSAGHLYVSTLAPTNSLGIQAKVPPAVRAALADIEGVAAVHESRAFTTRDMIGVDTLAPGAGAFEIFAGDRDHHAVVARGEALIGPGLARLGPYGPGDHIVLPGLDGHRTVRVGAVWGNPDNGGYAVTLGPALFRELFGDGPPISLRVVPAAGVDAEDLAARIVAADLDPDLRAYAPAALADEFTASIGGFMVPFQALQQAMLVVALVAVASTLLLVGVERSRERGVLVAVGMEPGQLGRMTVIEAGLVAVVGSVLATLAGVVVYFGMINVAPALTGLTAPFTPDLLAPVVPAAAGLAVVLVGAALPAWRSTRIDPALALRYE